MLLLFRMDIKRIVFLTLGLDSNNSRATCTNYLFDTVPQSESDIYLLLSQAIFKLFAFRSIRKHPKLVDYIT